jgi:glycine/D-amino acid oxidase-like deaminating enzyme
MADQLDVLIFGGGVAGLWTLARLRAAGLRVLLLESQALGRGQTIQSQGIIHGGGKYALRAVRDFAAVRAIRDMPVRWRAHVDGQAAPDLSGVELLSDSCLLWLPRASLIARLQAAGPMRVVEQAGLLATRPRRVARGEWPASLRGSAVAVYEMAEPVVHTGSLLRQLAIRHSEAIRHYAPLRPGAAIEVESAAGVGFGGRSTSAGVDLAEWRHVRVRPRAGQPPVVLAPRAVVLAAGEGNAELLRSARVPGELMQRRPLRMLLLRGNLPALHGHCVVGGKTRLTVTSQREGDDTIWQVGGEIAERLADEEDLDRVHAEGAAELRRYLPGVELRQARMASYRAVRAEARDARQMRPSGVHVGRVAANAIVAWPTKLALAPLLAEEVWRELQGMLGPGPDASPGGIPPAGSGRSDPSDWEAWPRPQVSAAPWEEATWTPVP